jgi:hypothetical protein
MQMTQSPSSDTLPAIAPHDEHRSRWKLRLFTFTGRFRHRNATADSSMSGESVLPEFSTTALLQECELRDAVLADARRRLETLEADPETDELTLVMARHEVFRRKRKIAETFSG